MMMRALSIGLFSFVLLCGSASAQWGHVKGRFVLDGEVPKPTFLFKAGGNVKDAEVCAATDFVNDELVVDPASKGIQNIFIYMRKAKSVHPDLKKSEKSEVVFDQKGCRFKPHALFIRTDQTVKVKSDDPVAHNTHTFTLRNQPVNILIKPKEREGIDVKVPAPESLPMQVKCDLHPHMLAYWLILDHPYAAVTAKDGSFMIKNLPEGKNEFRVWHEKVGYVERKFVVEIKDGEVTDLGDVKVDGSKLQ